MREPPARRLKQPVFFLDRNLGRSVVAEALREAGAHVEVHNEHFAQDERDDVWLDAVGARGWIVVTCCEVRSFAAPSLSLAAAGRGRNVCGLAVWSGDSTWRSPVSDAEPAVFWWTGAPLSWRTDLLAGS